MSSGCRTRGCRKSKAGNHVIFLLWDPYCHMTIIGESGKLSAQTDSRYGLWRRLRRIRNPGVLFMKLGEVVQYGCISVGSYSNYFALLTLKCPGGVS